MIDDAARLAVMDRYAAYAHTLDDGQIEQWAECFTADGRLLTSRPLVVTGRKNLVEFGRLWLAAQPGPTRHVSWHHRMSTDGDQIRCRSDAALLQTTDAGVTVVFTATYRDVFAFEDDQWRIAERHVAMDVPGAHSSAGQGSPALLFAID